MLKSEVMHLAEDVCKTSDRVNLQKAVALELQKDILQLESELEEQGRIENKRPETISSLTEATSLQNAEIEAMKKQISESKQKLEELKAKKAQSEKTVGRLQDKRKEAEKHADEAVRISKIKDPQVEELGNW